MTYPVHVEAAAVNDAEEFRLHLAETSLQAAERLLLMLEKAIESLADFPKRYPLAPEAKTHHREIHQMFVGNYRVLYLVKDDAVRVLRIRRAAQRPFKAGELN